MTATAIWLFLEVIFGATLFCTGLLLGWKSVHQIKTNLVKYRHLGITLTFAPFAAGNLIFGATLLTHFGYSLLK